MYLFFPEDGDVEGCDGWHCSAVGRLSLSPSMGR